MLHRIGIADDTKRVGFIVHRRPPGDPNIKDTDPDRFFIPLATPEIWLRQGDPKIYSCAAADTTLHRAVGLAGRRLSPLVQGRGGPV